MLNNLEDDEELFDYETFCQTFLNLTSLLDCENSTFSSRDLNYNFSSSVDRNEIKKEEEYIKCVNERQMLVRNKATGYTMHILKSLNVNPQVWQATTGHYM